MKKLIKPFTISIIILSVIYVCYVAFININGLIVGTKIVENKHKVLEVAEMSKTSYGKFVGLKQGDMIVKINNKKPSLKYLKGDTLYHVKSLDIKRNGQQIHLDDFDIVNLNGYYSYFLFVLPLYFIF